MVPGVVDHLEAQSKRLTSCDCDHSGPSIFRGNFLVYRSIRTQAMTRLKKLALYAPLPPSTLAPM
jgi:hypothetical protein